MNAEPAASSVPTRQPQRVNRSRPAPLARLRDLTLIPVVLVLLLIGFFVDPVFLTTQNLTNVLQQQTELSLVVLAEAMILISGKFDLSLESTVGLAPALAVLIVTGAFGLILPQELAIPLTLLIGAAIGFVNGFLILKFRLSAFIVTLGMLIVLRGLQVGFTGGRSLFELPPSMNDLGIAVWLGIPASIWICLAIYVAAIVFLSHFRQGRALYVIGGNVDAARAAGIRTDRVVWSVFVLGRHPGRARRRPARRAAWLDRGCARARRHLHGVRRGGHRRHQPRWRQGHAVRRALRRHRARPHPEHTDAGRCDRRMDRRDLRRHHPGRADAGKDHLGQGAGLKENRA